MLKNKNVFEAVIQYNNNRYYRLTHQLFNSIKEAKMYIKSNVDDRLKHRCKILKKLYE